MWEIYEISDQNSSHTLPNKWISLSVPTSQFWMIVTRPATWQRVSDVRLFWYPHLRTCRPFKMKSGDVENLKSGSRYSSVFCLLLSPSDNLWTLAYSFLVHFVHDQEPVCKEFLVQWDDSPVLNQRSCIIWTWIPFFSFRKEIFFYSFGYRYVQTLEGPLNFAQNLRKK